MQDRIILPIKPQPRIQFDSGNKTKALFFIPEECKSLHRVTKKEEDKGKPCPDYESTGKCDHILSYAGKRRKMAIERYNKYRMDLFHLAKTLGVQLQPFGMSIYFHFAMPLRWNKTKKALMAGQIHLRAPDCDNLLKGCFDSLTGTDEQVGQLSGTGKFWTDKEEGFIEILYDQPVYNPYNVSMLPTPLLQLSSYEERLKQRQARKAEIQKEKDKLPKRKPKPVKVQKKYKVTDELK